MSQPTLTWTSDRSIRVQPIGSDGTHASLTGMTRLFARAIRDIGLGWVQEIVPSSGSVLVVLDPLRISPEEAERAIVTGLGPLETGSGLVSIPEREVEIPVCYEMDRAPDLALIAQRVGVSVEEVIALHAGGRYTVEAIGFSPGFGYLSGLDARLHTPRLPTPRTRVPSGSVAIGGDRTGVYPQASPGGWRIIGRTPLRLFDVAREPPAVLAVGDAVRFVRISTTQFERRTREPGGCDEGLSNGGRR